MSAGSAPGASMSQEELAAYRILVNGLAPGDLHDDYDGDMIRAARAAVEQQNRLRAEIDAQRSLTEQEQGERA